MSKESMSYPGAVTIEQANELFDNFKRDRPELVQAFAELRDETSPEHKARVRLERARREYHSRCVTALGRIQEMAHDLDQANIGSAEAIEALAKEALDRGALNEAERIAAENGVL